METDKALAISYCKAWNNLDVSYLENIFTNDFVYSSQMVLSNLNGKDAYLEYITEKFISIQRTNAPVKAELGAYNNVPCVVIVQKLDTPEPTASFRQIINEKGALENIQEMTSERTGIILLTFDQGKIATATMCSVAPDIRQIARSGEYPR